VDCACGELSQEGFELCEGFLDRVEIGAIGRQIDERGTTSFDCPAHAGNFVTAEIVHDDDIAGRERGREDLFDIGEEGLAIHRSVEDERRGEAAGTQPGDKGRCFPMPIRNRRDEPLATRSASALARHVGGCPGLIDKDQTIWIQACLVGAPNLPCGRNIRPLLLGGVKRLFLSVSPRARRKRPIEERPT
jgi:hypothetical protein